MEDLALLVLKWIGNAIASRSFNNAINIAWPRVSPLFKQLIETAGFWRRQADKNVAVVEEIEAVTEQVLQSLATANDRIIALRAENLNLKQRLKKYEKETTRDL